LINITQVQHVERCGV